MARYSLNLPQQLKHEAEHWAAQQGVSLNQFVLWAVAEKVGACKQQLDDASFPLITYRRGASGEPTAVVRGRNVAVKTLIIALQDWAMTVEQVALEYDISLAQAKQAWAFYQQHQHEIDVCIAADQALEATHG